MRQPCYLRKRHVGVGDKLSQPANKSDCSVPGNHHLLGLSARLEEENCRKAPRVSSAGWAARPFQPSSTGRPHTASWHCKLIKCSDCQLSHMPCNTCSKHWTDLVLDTASNLLEFTVALQRKRWGRLILLLFTSVQ